MADRAFSRYAIDSISSFFVDKMQSAHFDSDASFGIGAAPAVVELLTRQPAWRGWYLPSTGTVCQQFIVV